MSPDLHGDQNVMRVERDNASEFAVAAVIVHYRRFADLQRIFHQLTSEYGRLISHIVISDNGSTPDESREIEALCEGNEFVPCTYLRRENDGYGAAANAGVQAAVASGCDPEFLFIATHELQLQTGALEHLIAFMRSERACGIAAPILIDSRDDVTIWSTGGDVSAIRRITFHHHDEPDEPIARDWVDGSAMLIRNRAFSEAEGFAPEFFLYNEDVELCHRVRDHGWSVHVLPDAVGSQSPGGHDNTYLAVRNTLWVQLLDRAYLAAVVWILENTARILVGFVRPSAESRQRQRLRRSALADGIAMPASLRRRRRRRARR